MLKTYANARAADDVTDRRERARLEPRDVSPARDDQSAPAFVIETTDSAAGIVIRQADGYRFFSADAQFSLLDGSIFKTPKAAQKAAELMQRAAARDYELARRFSDWHDRDGRPAQQRRA